MKSLLLALAVAGACSPALADSVRLYAESPYNGSYLPNGTRWGSGGLATSSDQVNGVRAITEFSLSSIPSVAGYAVVVHSARFEVRVVGISGVGADRLAFYAYEGDGVVEGADYHRGSLIERFDTAVALDGYYGVDATGLVQAAVDHGSEWLGFQVRNDGGISFVSFFVSNIHAGGQTFEYAPRLVVEYSLLQTAVVPLPSVGALAGFGTFVVAGRRVRR